MTKKQKQRQRVVLEHELMVLGTVTVNDQSDELLQVAAPDTFDLIKAYFERRLRDLAT